MADRNVGIHAGPGEIRMINDRRKSGKTAEDVLVVIDITEDEAVVAGNFEQLVTIPRALLPDDVEVDSLVRLRTDRLRNMFAIGQREALSEADSGAGAPQLVQETLQAVATTLGVPQHVAADYIAHTVYLSGSG